MAVLVAGMTVGPTFGKNMEKLARKAMCIAIVAMAIAAHHIILMVVGNDYWLRLFVNGSGILFVVLTCSIQLPKNMIVYKVCGDGSGWGL
ncbi:unnamed protein product [Lactuca virosa]|uniref:Inner membrane protein n=1 Tax=Lactuca virosa TaxID=75947 RepID=A0AAU9P2R9_9ASTR|nr:unnamed protein product [Lactuca virosa]